MLRHPNYIQLLPDIWDPDFVALNREWVDQYKSEIKDLIAQSKMTIAESRALMELADRMCTP